MTDRREIVRDSRLFTRGCVDGRSRHGRYLSRCRAELLRHVGADASPVMLALVDRVAMVRLRLALLDERAAAGQALSATEERSYVALSGSLARLLARLGPPAAAPAPSLVKMLCDAADAANAAARAA
jgi:hypothetical protein